MFIRLVIDQLFFSLLWKQEAEKCIDHRRTVVWILQKRCDHSTPERHFSLILETFLLKEKLCAGVDPEGIISFSIEDKKAETYWILMSHWETWGLIIFLCCTIEAHFFWCQNQFVVCFFLSPLRQIGFSTGGPHMLTMFYRSNLSNDLKETTREMVHHHYTDGSVGNGNLYQPYLL